MDGARQSRAPGGGLPSGSGRPTGGSTAWRWRDGHQPMSKTRRNAGPKGKAAATKSRFNVPCSRRDLNTHHTHTQTDTQHPSLTNAVDHTRGTNAIHPGWPADALAMDDGAAAPMTGGAATGTHLLDQRRGTRPARAPGPLFCTFIGVWAGDTL
jgi:hypothetical protein